MRTNILQILLDNMIVTLMIIMGINVLFRIIKRGLFSSGFNFIRLMFGATLVMVGFGIFVGFIPSGLGIFGRFLAVIVIGKPGELIINMGYKNRSNRKKRTNNSNYMHQEQHRLFLEQMDRDQQHFTNEQHRNIHEQNNFHNNNHNNFF